MRIATVIRTIVHHTSQSHSLLHQLKSPELPLLSNAYPMPTGNIAMAPIFLAYMQFGASGMRYLPMLGGDKKNLREVPKSEWWNQTLTKLNDGVLVTRQTIVLGAANTDGGAHVDPKLRPDYEVLGSEGGLITWHARRDGVAVRLPSPNLHYVALRTMGWELLNSRRLRALAGKYLDGPPPSNPPEVRPRNG